MSLEYLPDGWMCFADGRKWRVSSPRFLCEVAEAGHIPNYAQISSVPPRIRRIKAFYSGRVDLGLLDEFGTGLDILVANSLAESFGTVPSPLNTAELREIFDQTPGNDPGVKLDEVVRSVAIRAKNLERREPGYIDPVSTPRRVSIGAHHVLISTALSLTLSTHPSSVERRTEEIVDLVCRLPAESLYAASLAVRYFVENYTKHQNQPPLLAATYNAGSPRPASDNPWNLRQYGNHIDRWICYYNTSRIF